MSPSASFRDAAASAARRRQLASTGRRTTASIRTVRPTGELIGIARAVELVLELDAGTDRARTLRTIEALPLGLAHLAVAGTDVTVVVADESGDVMIEWSR